MYRLLALVSPDYSNYQKHIIICEFESIEKVFSYLGEHWNRIRKELFNPFDSNKNVHLRLQKEIARNVVAEICTIKIDDYDI